MGFVSKIYLVSEQEFRDIVAQSCNLSECLRKFGLSADGGSSRTILKRRIAELNCSTEHFCIHNVTQTNGRRIPLEEILVEHSTYSNRDYLKKRLLRAGLLQYKCDGCGLTKWRNKYISLQLEHKNGINDDNRLENLTLLCPNCHSQTETYAGKNTRQTRAKYHKDQQNVYPVCGKRIARDSKFCPKHRPQNIQVMWPDKQTLQDMYKQMSIRKMAMSLGVSRSGLTTKLKQLGIHI